MTITLVGSSRELRNRTFLPPIDLLDILSGNPAAPVKAKQHVAQTASGLRHGAGGNKGVAATPRSLVSGDGFAQDLDPFLALLGSKHRTPLKGDDAVEGEYSNSAPKPFLAAMLPRNDATIGVVDTSCGNKQQRLAFSGKTTNATVHKNHADTCPSTLRFHGAPGPGDPPDAPAGSPPSLKAPTSRPRDIAGCASKFLSRGDHKGAARSGTDGDVGSPNVLHAPSPAPVRPRSGPMPCYTRGTSADGGGVRRRRKSRRKGGVAPTSRGSAATSMLRLCPKLEARILDLRRDNTAVARFLEMAQAAAWQRARRPVGILVSRNRAVCALEGAELALLRREELMERTQRRREANRERKLGLERRRRKQAEATRVKHEGLSMAEVRAQRQAATLERRQQFFLTAVVAITSVMQWRNDWKERKWRVAKLAEALAQDSEEKATRDVYEASVVRVQRFIRRRRGGTGDSRGGGYGSSGRPNVIRCLKGWIPSAHATWKRRRQRGGVVIYDFLKEARLSQNLKAIYHFRRKVLWCQAYVRGFHLITRDRLVLLGLFFGRCEVRLRTRLAGRIRKQVHNEAVADLEVHRQLMRLTGSAENTAAAAAAAVAAAAANGAGGGRWGTKKRNNNNNSNTVGNRGGTVAVAATAGVWDVDEGVSALMKNVAALRLKSALEELETRTAHPKVKHRLLEGLLEKVRAVHQANIQLSSRSGAGKGGRDSSDSKGQDESLGSHGGDFPLPDAVFTVDDARKMFLHSPPPPAVAHTPCGDNFTGGGIKKRHRGSCPDDGKGRGAGSAGAPPSTVGKAPGDKNDNKQSFDRGGGSKSGPTRVSPLLLLKGVPEGVMCQLVLAGWEQSFPSGKGNDGRGH